MTVLEDAADYLEDGGVATVGADLFLSMMPPTPDVCIALHEYSGMAPRDHMGGGGVSLELPRLQAVCRAGRGDYPAARDAAIAVSRRLAAVVDVSWPSGRVLRIVPAGSVNDLGRDEKDRPIVSVNFEVMCDAAGG